MRTGGRLLPVAAPPPGRRSGGRRYPPPAVTAPSPARRPWTLAVLVALLIALARLWALSADPPIAFPDMTVMDEGLWADSARGAVRFGDRFADDLGNAWLVAPLYTGSLELCYRIFGVGLWQTRLPSALCSIALAILLGVWLGRRLRFRAGVLAMALAGLCPLLDQFGRFALLESSQAFWILLAFALLLPPGRFRGQAFLAGLAMAAAMATKPNTVSFGVVPLGAAFLWDWRGRARAGEAGVHRDRLRDAAAAVAGGTLGLAALLLPAWLPHWDAAMATLAAEGGMGTWRPLDHLLHWGLIGSRESEPGVHRLWGLLRHAPLACAGVWLWCLQRTRGDDPALPPWERAAAAWLLTALLVGELSDMPVTRRQVLFVAPMLMLTVAWVCRRRDRAVAGVPAGPRGGVWALLLLPPLLVLKPAVCNALAPALAPLWPDGPPGAAGRLAGLAFVAVATAAILAARRLPWDPRRLVPPLLRAGPALLLLCGLGELLRLGAWPPHSHTIVAAQRELAAHVEPGEIALGQFAALLLQEAPVRTVRRVLPGAQYSQPRPNPDVWDRLQPRYLVDYLDPDLREFADLIPRGYRLVSRVALVRERDGSHRFEVGLWQRP